MLQFRVEGEPGSEHTTLCSAFFFVGRCGSRFAFKGQLTLGSSNRVRFLWEKMISPGPGHGSLKPLAGQCPELRLEGLQATFTLGHIWTITCFFVSAIDQCFCLFVPASWLGWTWLFGLVACLLMLFSCLPATCLLCFLGFALRSALRSALFAVFCSDLLLLSFGGWGPKQL